MSDFGDMAKRLKKFRKSWKDGITDTTRRAMQRMEGAVQVQLADNNSVVDRNLLRSIQYERDPNVDALFAAHIDSAHWGKYVEFGTGSRGVRDYEAPDPGPPYEDILQWVINKPVIPREYDSQYALASAITETIAQQGQIPRPFMRPVWFDDSQGYQSVVDANHEELKKQLRRL